ncbi:MAG: PD-(D/E)XK nuclease family protein [Bacteroidetes bacterium]|nr:PD-(D/E)XK nuclease family protein [Bacteroidota bacterium]
MILSKVKRKSIDLDSLIDKKIKAGQLNELLLIVPTNRKIRSLKREMISLAPGQATGKINLETIGTFSTNLLFVNGNSKGRILSEAASIVLLKQSFLESNLKYFSVYKKEIPQGTIIRIKNVISEYKKQGITPLLLRAEAEELSGSEKIKAEDIANIYEIYLNKCKQLNAKEIGDIYNELIQNNIEPIEKNFRKLYPEVNMVVINGFDEFTSPEIEIIDFTSQIKNCELYISFDYFSNNSIIFSHLDKCYGKLIKKNFSSIKDDSSSARNKFQAIVKESLFKKASKSKIIDFKDSITKISGVTREKEIEFAAKEIKKLITVDKVEPHKICVAFNLIQKYSPIVRDIFQVYNLPFNLTDRISLSSSSPVISVINFLEILENDFYYKNIFRALSGGYFKLKNIDTSNLLKVSINLKIISGYNNWVDTIQDAITNADDKNEDENNFVVIKKEVYKNALSDIKKLFNHLSAFNKMQTIDEFKNNLNNLIFTLQLPSNLINDLSGTAEENIKGITTFLDLLDEIFELFKLEFGRNKKFPLLFFMNNLRTAISSSRFNIKEKSNYGVQITTLNEIRGLKFDHLFISGLCDGDLPTRYSPEIFFSGSFSRNEMNHQTEERYRFYQSLCSWEKHLYLTYPLQEDKKELIESNISSEFTELFDVTVKNEKDYSDSIYSKEELLIYLGQTKCGNISEELSEADEGIDLSEIKKAIEVNELRLSQPFGKSEYTGYIGENLSNETKEKLNEFESKEYSISQLETYAKCPYKYLAERILKLEPMKEPTEDIEALEMGSILHDILFSFYKKIRSEGIVLSKASDDQFKYAEKLIFDIAGDIIDKANFNSPLTFYEKEKILGINGDRKNSILHKFLTYERENADGYIPQYFEFGFGNISDDNEELSSTKKMQVGSVSVRGKIDRIDIDSDNKNFKVVDYKLSGKKPTSLDLIEGLSLQLPLYLFAAKEMIKAQLDKELEPAGSEIYSLKFDNKEFGKKIISQLAVRKNMSSEKLIEANNELIEICLSAIKKYVKEIAEGKFNLSTLKDRENKICRYCSFRPICRIQEVN